MIMVFVIVVLIDSDHFILTSCTAFNKLGLVNVNYSFYDAIITPCCY